MVGELVTKLSKRECFTLSEFDTLKTASEKLQKYNVGAMPVLSKQNNDLIGIVSERDLARFIFKDEFKNDLPVTKIMTKQIITCNLNTSVTELMEIINHNAYYPATFTTSDLAKVQGYYTADLTGNMPGFLWWAPWSAALLAAFSTATFLSTAIRWQCADN